MYSTKDKLYETTLSIALGKNMIKWYFQLLVFQPAVCWLIPLVYQHYKKKNIYPPFYICVGLSFLLHDNHLMRKETKFAKPGATL